MRRVIFRANDELLWDSMYPSEERPILNPKAKLEVNKAGQASFTILPGHILYDSLERMKTVITIEMNGRIIFRGRVIDMTTDLYKQRNVTCESDLAFLLDSIIGPYTGTRTVRGFLEQVVAAHNKMTEAFKHFTVGEVSITEADESKRYQIDGYSSASDLISSELLQEYGGILRTRTENGVTYLDYVEDPFTAPSETVNSQEVQFGVNLVDLSNESYPINEIFSVLVPLGANNTTIAGVNDGSIYLVSEDAADKYGLIYRTEQWSDISTPRELLQAASKYMMGHARAFPNDLTVKALDLIALDPTAEEFKMGDNIRVSVPHLGIDEVLYCLSVEYDFQNSGSDSYKIGTYVPSDKQKGSTAQKRGGGGGGGGGDGETSSEKNASHGRSAKKASAGVSNLSNDVNTLKEELPEWEQKITDNAGNIAQLTITATQIQSQVTSNTGNISTLTQTANSLTSEIATAKGSISTLTQTAASLTSQITDATDDISTLKQTARQLESDISSANGNISTLTQTASRLETRLSTAEGDVSTLKQTANGLTSRVQTAEGNISTLQQTADDLSLTVAGKVDKSSITITQDSITIGTDTFTVDATTIIDRLVGTHITVNSITAGSSTFDGTVTMNGLNVGGTAFSAHSIGHSSTGFVTVLATDDLNLNHKHVVTITEASGVVTVTVGDASSGNNSDSFNIADTQFYADAVSAARSAGANSVTLTVGNWNNTGYCPVTASNGRTANVSTPPLTMQTSSWTTDHKCTVSVGLDVQGGNRLTSTTVDATDVYNDGLKYGKLHPQLSVGGWTNSGTCVVTAYQGLETGTTATVSLPSFSSSASSWSNGSCTVSFTASGISAALRTHTVNMPSSYNSFTIRSNLSQQIGVTVTGTCTVGGKSYSYTTTI